MPAKWWVCFLLTSGCVERGLAPDDEHSARGSDLSSFGPSTGSDLARTTDLYMGTDAGHTDIASVGDATSSDLRGPVDLALVDLSSVGDQAPRADLSEAPDLGGGIDLKMVGDQSVAGDLSVVDLHRPAVDLAVTDLARVPRAVLAFGSATTLQVTALGKTPEGIAFGDFNEDRAIDIVSCNWGVNYTGDVALLQGVGDGSFLAPRNLYAGPGPFNVVVSDIDRDGHEDIVSSSSTFWLLFGDGAAEFSTETYGGEIARATVPFDADHDGVLDFFTAEANTEVIRSWHGMGGGKFTSTTTASVSFNPMGMVQGRFTGTGQHGLATFGYGSAQTQSPSYVAVLMINDDGSLGPVVTYSSLSIPTDIATADVSGDGVDDLILSLTAGGFEIYLANGDGTFQNALSVPGLHANGVVVADLDTDGLQDVVLGGTQNLQIYRNTGRGAFATPLVMSAPNNPVRLIAPDLNSDGLPDLAMQNWDTTVTVILNMSQ